MNLRTIPLFLILLSTTLCFAQSSRVQRFNIKPSNNGSVVQVLWTMSAGSTCLDLIVERSVNGTDYSEIYKYPSVCGSTDEAISYSWVDDSPLQFSKSFYRLKLDGSEFTLPIEIDLQSNLSEKNIISYPNPSDGNFVVELKNGKNLFFDLEIYHPNGTLIYRKEKYSGTVHSINLVNIPSGIYVLKAFFSDRNSLESTLIIR